MARQICLISLTILLFFFMPDAAFAAKCSKVENGVAEKTKITTGSIVKIGRQTLTYLGYIPKNQLHIGAGKFAFLNGSNQIVLKTPQEVQKMGLDKSKVLPYAEAQCSETCVSHSMFNTAFTVAKKSTDTDWYFFSKDALYNREYFYDVEGSAMSTEQYWRQTEFVLEHMQDFKIEAREIGEDAYLGTGKRQAIAELRKHLNSGNPAIIGYMKSIKQTKGPRAKVSESEGYLHSVGILGIFKNPRTKKPVLLVTDSEISSDRGTLTIWNPDSLKNIFNYEGSNAILISP